MSNATIRCTVLCIAVDGGLTSHLFCKTEEFGVIQIDPFTHGAMKYMSDDGNLRDLVWQQFDMSDFVIGETDHDICFCKRFEKVDQQ